jgi:hypothetical protein
MKPEATHLIEAQRCEIIKMNGILNIDDANNKEYFVVMLEDVNEVLETMGIEEELPIDDKIQPIKTFVDLESATNL